MIHFVRLSWIVTFVAVWALPCDAQHNAINSVEQAEQADANMDFDQLVISIANKNAQPMIVGEPPDQKPLFQKNYNWKEHTRVLKAIQILVDHAEEAWPAMIEHLGDKRYCVTFEHDQSVSNDSVGTVCYIILKENLAAAYMPHIPADEEAFRKLRHPVRFARFKDWTQEQHEMGRELYELQIEACEWAIKKMPELTNVAEEERHESIVKIQKQIDDLQKAKKPTLIKTIIQREARIPFSEKRAEQIRISIEAR
jgi:hypothetical protein